MIVAPSLLSADFAHLADEVERVKRGGAGLLHVDVMDGHFVPNITLGPPVVRAIRKATDLPLDCHLMIESADRWLDAFIDAGANWISLHVEALPHLQRSVARLRDRGIQAGVALNPSTPIACLEEILPELDYVLIMSVNPGFSAQSFLPGSIDKVRRLRAQLRDRALSTRIEVDGGVDVGNIRLLKDAGADIAVAGNAVFGQADAEAAVRRLLQECA
jgi:ribulose-phosphate 3-epimerase